jgi:phage FluMu protein Com
MSNFICEKCGALIVEDSRGYYKTECPHYPMSDREKERVNKETLTKEDLTNE